ncbi:hypothetical protein Xcel_0129 [Xylanimonas cellulosilytica DSM 15894]|uniref:Polymerase nucleotidyl transferase domain-containing protein n=1 Tax=Xylanimonas cellulosilytica (strain DSM 15894 / JCM 12276 / CECT 5975 / KCTC 9989 / LMG 20990 / NBRC 107835 / XIL07) TaxID=446471 RepID=D1BU06_XYLCX|nr:nucleotidyltransferase domain-containing protein [Xylanimonas cellulosilytica]ACZ29170.1 hypothetical protein Xcel_0129 [Xylanimonas cellulosilytica DSM 15894]
MQLQSPFAVITPTLDGPVLNVLAMARAAFTPGQVARLLDVGSVEGVRKVLNRLVDQGIVHVQQIGRARAYELNRDHLAAGAVEAIARQHDVLIQRLADEVARWTAGPTFGALFGSAARREMRPDSDLDVFLVRPDTADLEVWDEQTTALAAAATLWTGNDARVLDMTESEIAAGAVPVGRAGVREPVLAEIVADGIQFAGPAGWLARQIRDARGTR